MAVAFALPRRIAGFRMTAQHEIDAVIIRRPTLYCCKQQQCVSGRAQTCGVIQMFVCLSPGYPSAPVTGACPVTTDLIMRENNNNNNNSSSRILNFGPKL